MEVNCQHNYQIRESKHGFVKVCYLCGDICPTQSTARYERELNKLRKRWLNRKE